MKINDEFIDHELDSIHEQRSNFGVWLSNLECLKMAEYQRPPTWPDEMAIKLLEDMRIDYDNNRKFDLGTIMVYAPSPKHAELGDGQQRSTTIVLALQAFGHVVKFRNEALVGSEASQIINQLNVDHTRQNDGLLYTVNDSEKIIPRIELTSLMYSEEEDELLTKFGTKDNDLNTVFTKIIQIETADEFEKFVSECTNLNGNTSCDRICKIYAGFVTYWTEKCNTEEEIHEHLRMLMSAPSVSVKYMKTRDQMSKAFMDLNQGGIVLNEKQNTKAAAHPVYSTNANRTIAMQLHAVLETPEYMELNSKARDTPKSWAPMDTIGARTIYSYAQMLSPNGEVIPPLYKSVPECLSIKLTTETEEEQLKEQSRCFMIGLYTHQESFDGIFESRHGLFAGLQNTLGVNNANVGALNMLLSEAFSNEADLLKAGRICYSFAANMDFYHIIFENGQTAGKNPVVEFLIGAHSPLRQDCTVNQLQRSLHSQFRIKVQEVLTYDTTPQWSAFARQNTNKFNKSIASHIAVLSSLKEKKNYRPTGHESLISIVQPGSPKENSIVKDQYGDKWNNDNRNIARNKLGSQVFVNTKDINANSVRINDGGKHNSRGFMREIKRQYPYTWNDTMYHHSQYGEELDLETIEKINTRKWDRLLKMNKEVYEDTMNPTNEKIILDHFGANKKLVYRVDDIYVDFTMTDDLMLEYKGDKLDKIESLPGGDVLSIKNELMVKYVVPKNKKDKAPNILESKTF